MAIEQEETDKNFKLNISLLDTLCNPLQFELKLNELWNTFYT